MNQLDISINRTLYRKATYVPSFLEDKYYNTNLLTLCNSNQRVLKRTMEICTENRDIQIFLSPYKFIVFFGDNNAPRVPRIMKTLPKLYTINLKKIIIPKYTTIHKDIILLTEQLVIDINAFLMLNISSFELNKTYYVLSIGVGYYVTIVNYTNNKINFVLNFDKENVYNFNYTSGYASFISAYRLYINRVIDTNDNRIFHLNIKELNDNNLFATDDMGATFRIIPVNMTENYMYGDTRNIKKIHDRKPLSIGNLNIELRNGNDRLIRILYLDDSVREMDCECSIDDVDYSCSCSYILHPKNPLYQMELFFEMEYVSQNIESELNL